MKSGVFPKAPLHHLCWTPTGGLLLLSNDVTRKLMRVLVIGWLFAG